MCFGLSSGTSETSCGSSYHCCAWMGINVSVSLPFLFTSCCSLFTLVSEIWHIYTFTNTMPAFLFVLVLAAAASKTYRYSCCSQMVSSLFLLCSLFIIQSVLPG